MFVCCPSYGASHRSVSYRFVSASNSLVDPAAAFARVDEPLNFSAIDGTVRGRLTLLIRAAFMILVACGTANGLAPCLALQAEKPDSEASNPADKSAHKSGEPNLIDPVPVTRILLYSSGVAQVLHEGEVDGSVLMELPFSGHDVDDVLKSLVLQDASGSKQSIVYTPAPDRESIAAKEHEEPVSFAQLLQKYRGEKVNLKSEDKLYSGNILGVENRSRKDETVETLLLMTNVGVQAIPINGMSEFNFESAALKQELELSFAGLIKSRDATRRRVGLRFEGEGKRTVRFSYVVDSPIWRITYRLALEDATSRLQGWVHLDNVFGYDWNEVEIILRSGRPAIFHADMFAPIIAERKSVGSSVFDIPDNVTLVTEWYGFDPPKRFGGAGGDSGLLPLVTNTIQGSGMGGGGMGGGMGGGGMAPDDKENRLDHSQVVKQASIIDSKRGLLEFKLKQRVSLPAGKSAAIPLWEENFPSRQLGEVSCGRLLEDQSIESVPSIIDLENRSELPLLMAPVAIYESGSFVGDSKIETTPPKDKTKILYATDVGIQIKSKVRQIDNSIRKLAYFGENKWLVVRELKNKVLLSLKNQHQKEKQIQMTFVVPLNATISPKMEIAGMNKGTLSETVKASSQKDLELDVTHLVEEQLNTEDFLNADELLKQGLGILNEADKTRLNKLKELKQSLAVLADEERVLSDRLRGLFSDQNRWSDLAKKLELSADAREKYVVKITDAEDQLAAIKLDQAKISNRKEELQRSWSEALELKKP